MIRRVASLDNPDEAGIRRDKAAPLALYDATKGKDHWDNKDGWNTNAPLRSWHGVTTDEETGERNPTGRVVRLELPKNRLCGEIPSDLDKLTELTHLDLSYNACDAALFFPDTPGLQKGIPAELGNLTKLESLNLSGNQLSGKIPASLGNLAALKELDLSKNRRLVGGQYFGGLKGSVPHQLSQLNNLTTLKLNNNLLTGDIADVLYRFEDRDGRDGLTLEVVDVSNNKFDKDDDRDWNSLKGEMKVATETCPGGTSATCTIARSPNRVESP